MQQIRYSSDIETENWLPIHGYESLYEISNFGRLKSLKKLRGKRETKNIFLSRPKECKKGYLHYRLITNGKSKQVSAHRLVANAFIQNPTSRPCVNHIDGNKKNNHVSNLEWVDFFENINHAVKIQLLNTKGEKHFASKLTDADVVYIYKSGKSNKELADQFNVCFQTIQQIKKGRAWNHITGLPNIRLKQYKTKRYSIVN